MKINLTPDTEKSRDYILIGIACHVKEYKFCWLLNSHLGLNLGRISDYEYMQGGKNETKNILPVFFYEEPNRQEQYFLVGNHGNNGNLIPRNETGYLLFIKDFLSREGATVLIEKIKKINQVMTAFSIKFDDVPNMDSVLSDLELLLMEHKMESKKKKPEFNEQDGDEIKKP